MLGQLVPLKVVIASVAPGRDQAEKLEMREADRTAEALRPGDSLAGRQPDQVIRARSAALARRAAAAGGCFQCQPVGRVGSHFCAADGSDDVALVDGGDSRVRAQRQYRGEDQGLEASQQRRQHDVLGPAQRGELDTGGRDEPVGAVPPQHLRPAEPGGPAPGDFQQQRGQVRPGHRLGQLI
jgi:hypothetical protein